MDNNDMYQNEQPTGTEPENNQLENSNGNEYQNNYNGNDYTGNNYNANNYTGNNSNSNNYNSNYQQYPYNNYNGNYQVPYQQNSPLDLEEPVKMSEWLISLLIMLIPCIGLIMTFVWAFGSTEKKSKSNFFKAWLVYELIGLIFFLVWVFFIAAYSATYGVNF